MRQESEINVLVHLFNCFATNNNTCNWWYVTPADQDVLTRSVKQIGLRHVCLVSHAIYFKTERCRKDHGNQRNDVKANFRNHAPGNLRNHATRNLRNHATGSHLRFLSHL